MTRLPSATTYLEAVQDPSSCFADPELAGAEPVLGPLGLPRPVSGNVATVFRLDSAGGSWAVRCFVRPVDRARQRYEAISAHLANLGSPWRVEFEFQPRGIRVDGQWWPVVKMAWAAGEPLLSYVERHLWDGPALAYLASRFEALAQQLRDDEVAHGDLQHGNILVAPGGDLRLVDYDGMYVPALAGWPGTERGHRNYQHPGRQREDFGPGLDSFSGWLIHASLTALSADPLLWSRLDGGEEGLLLRHHDLVSPGRSAALAEMENGEAGPHVAELVRRLRSFLDGDSSEVPTLSPPRTGLPTGAPVVPVADPGTGPLPDDNDGAAAALDRRRSLHAALAGAGAATAVPAPARPAPPAVPGHDPRQAPRVAVAAVAGPLLCATFAAGAGLSAAWAVVALVVIVAGLAGLARLPGLSRRDRVSRPVQRPSGPSAGDAARPSVPDALAVIAGLESRRAGLVGAEAAAAAREARARAELRRVEEHELGRIDSELDAALAETAGRSRDLDRAEGDARAAALVLLRARLLGVQLRRHLLVAAVAEGVTDTVVQRLAQDGVRTAADFTDVVSERRGATVVRRDGQRLPVAGMDPAQAAALLGWRRRLEAAAQLELPTVLAPESLAAVRADHAGRRAALEAEAEAARRAAQRRAEEVRARMRRQLEAVLAERRAVEADAAAGRVEIDRELARARKHAAEAEWRRSVTGHEAGPAA